jgi:nucleolysin TIA-1/TIAR
MPQPSTGGAALGLTGAPQQGVADPNAAAGQAGQAQWGNADPSSYYSNYWGGELSYEDWADKILIDSVQAIMVNNPPPVNRVLVTLPCLVKRKYRFC